VKSAVEVNTRLLISASDSEIACRVEDQRWLRKRSNGQTRESLEKKGGDPQGLVSRPLASRPALCLSQSSLILCLQPCKTLAPQPLHRPSCIP
jgi:hypothetical protein